MSASSVEIDNSLAIQEGDKATNPVKHKENTLELNGTINHHV